VSGWLVRHQRLVNGSAGAAVMAGSRTALLAVPEPLPWMAELGEVFYDLSLAWVTAWAFQFLVIVLPAERERRRFQELVAPRLDRLIVLGMDLNDAIYAKAKAPIEGDFSVDAALIKSVCRSTALSDDMPNWLGEWGIVLRHLGGLADKFRASLRPFYAKLPADVLEALDQEELAMDELMRMERFCRVTEAPDMSRLEGSVFRWLSSLHMLHSIRTSAVAPSVAAPKRSQLSHGSVKVPLDDFIRQHEGLKEFLKRDGG
jgi:hypothetical protein